MTAHAKKFRLKPKVLPDYITTRDAANELKVSIVTIRRYMQNNGLPYVKPAGRYLIPRKEFQEWVKKNNAYENTEADS